MTNCIVITLFFLSSFVLYRSRAGVAGDKLPISHAHGLTMLPSLAVLFLVPQLAFGPKKINKIVFFKKNLSVQLTTEYMNRWLMRLLAS